MDDTALLHNVPLFHDLNTDETLALRALMQRHAYSPGDLILREGEPGDSIHILLEGRAEIFTRDRNGREMLLDEVGEGAFFGELSLITGESRSASVRAVDPVRTIALERHSFLEFLQRTPHACFTVLTVIGQRLSRTSDLLRTTARNVNEIEEEQLSIGQRIADRFTQVMGSWTFIGIQSCLLLVYIIWNMLTWTPHWDPYPFLLMSLILSFQAAYAAPIIMMSQNRQTARDRMTVENNYQVNLKASAEIALILRRLDSLERSAGQNARAVASKPRNGTGSLPHERGGNVRIENIHGSSYADQA